MNMTSMELARVCGISRGTVDRALKGRPGVNKATRERVLAAARKYGYRPNLIGQTLVSGKSNTIGVILFDFSHDFFAELYSEFEQAADQYGFVPFPVLSYHNPEREMECIRRLLDRRVDGIIILPVNKGREFEDFLLSLPIPVATVANRLSDRFVFSGPDNRKASFDAADKLFSSGYRCIHYYSPTLGKKTSANRYAQEERRNGWLDARNALKFSGEEHHFLPELLGTLQPGDAVMVSSDFYALELQAELRENHPGLFPFITLMGFDGLDILRLFARKIATVSFSRKYWGQVAMSQIHGLIEGKKVDDKIIPHTIVLPEEIGQNA